jgi:glucokinase
MLRRKFGKTGDAEAEVEVTGDIGDDQEGKPSEAAPEGNSPVESEAGSPADAKPEGAPESETVKAASKPGEDGKSTPTPPTPTGPGPVARHSPEPQTLAERLTASQQRSTEAETTDPKSLMKERREASKRQRQADKAKRKTDKKAAKKARKARRHAGPGEPLELDPLAPTSPGSDASAESAAPPAVSPPATESRAPKPKAKNSSRINPDLDLPPITPPGATPRMASRRTAALIGGIDLGGTKIAASVLDENHKVISYRRRPTPDKGGPADVVRAMATTMQEAAIDAGTEAHKLLAVGVGSPGSVNAETGAVSGAGNLPDWDGTFQLGMALREELGTEVKVGNDVQVGTRGEFELGAGAEYESLLGVFWGTGVGGGIIMNSQPMLGRGRAGEIGHTLVRRGGAKGLNGLNGTVEAYAGRKAMEAKARREVKKGRKTKLFKLMKKHDKTHLTSAIWQRALDDGDELAEDLLNRAVAALSAGIGSAVNLLDPEAVVIGGGLGVRFADTLVPEIFEGMTPYLLNQENPPALKVASLGDEGGVIGASLLVKDFVVENQAPRA